MRLSPTTWTEAFLESRGLRRPDGRPLYAYRCTAPEFASLAEALADRNITVAPYFSTPRSKSIRAFVIYAAEWWQRHYDGGHWAWEPLLKSVDWHGVHYPDLYEPVREALHWWNVSLVRLPTSIRYLGTFACQGGLPLALIGDAHSRVMQYLRAVLRHTAAYRQFVDDAIVLARDQQHLLRPPTLRRDYVFRLAADLIEAVLYLRNDAQGEDPLEALDDARPGWRDTMPLDLNNVRARELLTGLLREAAQHRAAPVDAFRVDRFLRHTGIGWRLGARVRLPSSITAENLALHLKVPVMDLRSRLQVRMPGDRVRVFGMYAERADDYLLMSRDAQSVTELWDAEAAGEIRLQFVAGDVIGEDVVLARGGALGDLPWAFRGDDHEAPFISEGSASNRAPEIFILLSEADAQSLEATTEDILVLGRSLRTITEPTEIETSVGRCTIRPSAGQGAEEDYHLSGQRLYNLESDLPLFRGVPQLRISTLDSSRAVPAREVSWRQRGPDWHGRPIGFGLWEVRHVHGGELRHFSRLGILPTNFRPRLVPGDDMTEGYLELSGNERAMVTSHADDTECTTQAVGDTLRIHFRACDVAAVPVRIALRLHWQDAVELSVSAPFPGHGARFLRDGKSVDGALAVDDLYGVRATALSAFRTDRFFVEGELCAPDLRDVRGVAHLRVPLGTSGLTHELSLIHLRSTIELLLGASVSDYSLVRLRIVGGDQRIYGTLDVRRFAGAMVYNTANRTLVPINQTVDCEPPTTYEALPIDRPDADPVPLQLVETHQGSSGAVFPQGMNIGKPLLVVARHADRVRVRPLIYPRDADFVDDEDGIGLRGSVCVHRRNSRSQAIAAAMDSMLTAEGTSRSADDWSFLTDALLRAEGLPATAFDLLKVLATKHNFLVRCMFRLESTPRQLLWRLDDELPFSWLMIRRDIWLTEARQAFDHLRDQLDGVPDGIQIARNLIVSVLKEGTDRFGGLCTVSRDIGIQMQERERLTADIVDDARRKRDQKTQEQLNYRYAMNDWPTGDGRGEWAQKLEQGALLNSFAIWQREGRKPRERQPIFDTPIAAAWCCFASKPTNRTTFMVKRIRAHDPEWFDLAYEAAWFRLALMQDEGRIG